MPEPNPVENATRKSGPPPTAPETLQDRQTGGQPPPRLAAPTQPPYRIGRFEVRKLLGEGAFARVYLGFDPELEREVAIKVPKADALTPELRDTFLRENRLAAIVQHQNVCQIYDVGTDDGLPYIVMRVVPGTLAGLLKRLPGPMPARNAIAIARKLALGLTAAHAQKVIHRDLKPANVLYDEVNREVLIADFGLARFADQASEASNGVPKGTPAYMAPEQARGLAAVVGPLSDVYSLGIILYEMLTGRVPFTGSVWEVLIAHNEQAPLPPSAVRRDLDPRLDALCLKALAKHPADRYPSAKAFANAMADYLRSSEQPAGRSPTTESREHAAPLIAAEVEEEVPGADIGPQASVQAVPLEIDDLPEASIPPKPTKGPPPIPKGPPPLPKPAEESRRPVAKPVPPAPPPVAPPRAMPVAVPTPPAQPKWKRESKPKDEHEPTPRRTGRKMLWVLLTLVVLGCSIFGVLLAVGMWGGKKPRPGDVAATDPGNTKGTAPLPLLPDEVKPKGPFDDPLPKLPDPPPKEPPKFPFTPPTKPKDPPVKASPGNALGQFDRLGTPGVWTAYKGDGFTAEFPGTAEVKTENPSGLVMKLAGVTVNDGGGAGVVSMEFPTDSQAQTIFDLLVKNLTDDATFKGKKWTDSTLGGRAAKQIDITNPDGEGRMRIALVKDRIYMAVAGTSTKASKPIVTKTEIDRFLQSVRITSGTLTLTERRAEAAADYQYGQNFFNGTWGPKDFAKARVWWERSANEGNASAQNDLGTLYHKGDGGPQDYRKARELYEKAAAQESPAAQNNLGIVYEYGLGVTKDLPTALRWYRKAVANGSDPAKKALERLEKK